MLIGILCMFGVVSLWSVTPTLIKIALRSFDPFTIAFYRLTIGAAVLLVAYVVRKGKARRLIQTDSFILIGGLGVTINYAFFCLSLIHWALASVGAKGKNSSPTISTPLDLI